MRTNSGFNKGRGQNGKGRSKRDEHHVRLYDHLLDSDAWQSLKPAEIALYIALAKRYFGKNNGKISMSVRQAARIVHIHRDTAMKAFTTLEDRGFIKAIIKGSFDYKMPHATTWLLTEYEYQGRAPTKDYLRWKNKNKTPS